MRKNHLRRLRNDLFIILEKCTMKIVGRSYKMTDIMKLIKDSQYQFIILSTHILNFY